MTPQRRAAIIKNLLRCLDEADPIACNCVLIHALNIVDHGDRPFDSTDPHVVVGAFVRKLIRDEEIHPSEHQRALEAAADLPPLGSDVEQMIAGARKRLERLERPAYLRLLSPEEPST